jgi:hypothetical protein
LRLRRGGPVQIAIQAVLSRTGEEPPAAAQIYFFLLNSDGYEVFKVHGPVFRRPWHGPCASLCKETSMNKGNNKMAYLDTTGSRLSADDCMVMTLSLEVLNGLGKAGLVAVPLEPSLKMLEAGARAGAVDTITAAAIYQAMLKADD